jgi:hypothetical protein
MKDDNMVGANSTKSTISACADGSASGMISRNR